MYLPAFAPFPVMFVKPSISGSLTVKILYVKELTLYQTTKF